MCPVRGIPLRLFRYARRRHRRRRRRRGGTTTDIYSFTTNPHYPGDGFNTWKVKTEQTLPDNSRIIVYSNYCGMTMLYVNVDPTGTRTWATFARYDADGRRIWKAHPSAVSGYDDNYADLLNYNSGTGKYQYLRDSDGLIEVTDRYAVTNIGLGEIEGYVQYQNVRKGQIGSDVRVSGFTYTSNTDANGVTIYLVATAVSYPDDSTTRQPSPTTASVSGAPSPTNVAQSTRTTTTSSAGRRTTA